MIVDKNNYNLDVFTNSKTVGNSWKDYEKECKFLELFKDCSIDSVNCFFDEAKGNVLTLISKENTDGDNLRATINFNQDIPFFVNNSWEDYQRECMLLESIKNCSIEGIVCEFGVLKAKTLNLIAKNFLNQKVYGFDSFEGLPEDWHLTDENVFEKGRMKIDSLPKVNSNVELVVGWYHKTIPEWKKTFKDNIKFIHIDCDLYSSTSTIFEQLNNQIVDGTVIQFDDFYNWKNLSNYTKWQQGIYKALLEWTEKFNRKFTVIGRSNHVQTTIKIIY